MLSIPNGLLEAQAKERATVMLALLAEGRSLESVGQLYSISRERVRQLVSKHYPVEYRKLPRGKTQKKPT